MRVAMAFMESLMWVDATASLEHPLFYNGLHQNLRDWFKMHSYAPFPDRLWEEPVRADDYYQPDAFYNQGFTGGGVPEDDQDGEAQPLSTHLVQEEPEVAGQDEEVEQPRKQVVRDPALVWNLHQVNLHLDFSFQEGTFRVC